MDDIAIRVVYAVRRVWAGSIVADLLRDLDLVGRKELLALLAEVGHVTGDDQHELTTVMVEMNRLEVTGVDAEEVILVVKSGGGEVGGRTGGDGRFGCGAGPRGGGRLRRGVAGLGGHLHGKREEDGEDRNAHGVAPSCWVQPEAWPGELSGFYNTAVFERRMDGMAFTEQFDVVVVGA